MADIFLAAMRQNALDDKDQVARLRAAIASGVFGIDPGAIADAMICFGGRRRLAARQFSDSMELSEN